MKTNLTLLILATILIIGCKKSSITGDKVINATIKNTDTYVYKTGVSGDEESATITIQASNAELSELKRDVSTNFEIYFYYKPNANFTGKDEIQITTYQGSDGTSPNNDIKTVAINLKIKE